MKEQFKKKVLDWLASEKVDISNRKVRVYNSPRYGLEVRLYSEPIDFLNSKRSFRKTHEVKNKDGSITSHGMSGIFSKKISLYTHINEKDFENMAERSFILDVLKGM